MHGAAVATVVAPIAIDTAQQTGLDPRALAMGVALAVLDGVPDAAGSSWSTCWSWGRAATASATISRWAGC